MSSSAGAVSASRPKPPTTIVSGAPEFRQGRPDDRGRDRDRATLGARPNSDRSSSTRRLCAPPSEDSDVQRFPDVPIVRGPCVLFDIRAIGEHRCRAYGYGPVLVDEVLGNERPIRLLAEQSEEVDQSDVVALVEADGLRSRWRRSCIRLELMAEPEGRCGVCYAHACWRWSRRPARLGSKSMSSP